MFLIVNIVIIAAYFLGFILDKTLSFPLLMQISGIIWLIILNPYNLLKGIGAIKSSRIVNYLIFITLFFFFYTPIYFIAHNSFGFPVNIQTILFVNITIFIISYLTLIWRKEQIIYIKLPKLKKYHHLLILGLIVFGITHAINYSFYQFIPEIDGYGEIRLIEEYIETESIGVGRKPALYTLGVVTSIFTNITPYDLFSFWLVIIQSTLIIVIYLFIQSYKIKNKTAKILLILSTIAVPVINMEIDVVRAQTGYIIGFPILIYFLYQAIKTKRFEYWIYSGLISVFSMLYHEFGVFMLGIFTITGFSILFKNYFLNTKDKKEKTIFIMSVGLFLSLFYSFAEKFRAIQFVERFIQRQSSRITNFSEWRWWFIDNYSTGIEEMGWPGFTGAMQYYGYYFSPVMVVITVLLIIVYIKLRKKLFLDNLSLILLPFILILLFIAEGLPRMNAPFLPERLWLLITLSLLILSVPLWKFTEQYLFKHTKYLIYAFSISIIIGMSGSFYIAYAKQARINQEEYKASLWIKENTPDNSIFITQKHNSLIVRHFGERKATTPPQEFFLSTEILPFTLDTYKILQTKLLEEKENLTYEFNNIIDNNFYNLDEFIIFISSRQNVIETLRLQIKELESQEDPTLYILYSDHKFKTLYAKRKWWQEANFYGANLDKFNENYPLIYNQDNIYIWKIE